MAVSTGQVESGVGRGEGLGQERDEGAIAKIVARVGETKKYRQVSSSIVRRIAAAEWGKRRSFRAALKATQSRLHQIYGAYESAPSYEWAYEVLAEAYAQGSQEAIRQASARVMELHASTRERIPILHQLYPAVWSRIGTPGSVLDLACGLNPVALPWMGLAEGTAYEAVDIDTERASFLNRYFDLTLVQGRATLVDLVEEAPDTRADVALLMKTSACLERQRKGSTVRLLDAVRARWAVVTFPAHSLGYKEKGMPQHYAQWMREMAAGRSWDVSRIDMAGELVYVVDKGSEIG